MDRSQAGSLASEVSGKTIGVDSICTTCNNAAICVFYKQANQSVIFCEEFESSIALPLKLYNIGEIGVKKSIDIIKTGLCANCDNINDCYYARLNEEVFYCKEYE